MSCPAMQELLHAYVDGELDLAHALEVEQHLQTCPACARVCVEMRELRTALRVNLPYFEPPAALRSRIRTALRQQDPPRRSAPKRWQLAGLVAALVLLAVGLAALWPTSSMHDQQLREVVDSHVRSQLVSRHLLDVESSDKHTVKPWFQGKLDFAPTVPDLTEEGFVLAGGRLDYITSRPVAALVYRRRQHIINLLIWPAEPGEKETSPRSETRMGYHVRCWRRQGMNWWAVSDLNSGELTEFARLLRD